MKNKIINIKEARTIAGSTIVEKGTKNNSSIRTLYMVDKLVSILKEEKKKQENNREFLGSYYSETDFVIVDGKGKPYRPNYLSELFKNFIESNDLPKLTLHGLRHSFASNANAQGVSMFDIGKALGHSTTATTTKIYTHMIDKTQAGIMKKVANSYSEDTKEE